MLLALYDDRSRASADVKALALTHLADMERKIAELRAMQATLQALVTACAGDQRPDCPILTGLALPGLALPGLADPGRAETCHG